MVVLLQLRQHLQLVPTRTACKVEAKVFALRKVLLPPLGAKIQNGNASVVASGLWHAGQAHREVSAASVDQCWVGKHTQGVLLRNC